MLKQMRLGAEFGGIQAEMSCFKPEAATPKKPMKLGAIGARITLTRKERKSQVRKQNICNGERY